MWKQFLSTSGLILLAVLGSGVWTSNALSFFALRNTPPVDALAAPSPSPMPSAVGIFEGRELTRKTAAILKPQCAIETHWLRFLLVGPAGVERRALGQHISPFGRPSRSF